MDPLGDLVTELGGGQHLDVRSELQHVDGGAFDAVEHRRAPTANDIEPLDLGTLLRW